MLEIKDVLCNMSPFNQKRARYCWFTGNIGLPLAIKIKAFPGDNRETPLQLHSSSSSSSVDRLVFSFHADLQCLVSLIFRVLFAGQMKLNIS